MPAWGRYFRSRLLLPVFAVLLVAIVLQVAVSILVSRANLMAMQGSVQEALGQSGEAISKELSGVQSDINRQMVSLAENVSTSMDKALEARLTQEQQGISTRIRDTLTGSARRVAEVIAAVSPPAVWDKNIPELTRLAQMADQDEAVVFAVFFDQDQKYMTRYLDRTDPRVQQLLASSTVRGSVNKVLDAASRSNHIDVIRVNIEPQGVVIGQFVIGVSTEKVKAEMAALRQRFDDLRKETGTTVAGIIGQQAGRVGDALKGSLRKVDVTLDDAITRTGHHIRQQAGKLMTLLGSLSVLLGAALFVVMFAVLSMRVVARINLLREAVRTVAQGEADLTQRIRMAGRDEIVETASGLNAFIERVQSIIHTVNGRARAARDKAEALARLADHAQDSVMTQKSEIDQITSAISEMSSTAHHVSEAVQQAAQGIESIRSETRETAQIADKVRERLTALVRHVQDSQAVVTELDSHTHDIGSVLDVIRSIAEQTNLLALNAAIEAARAGESGRGFAVVADEVRALASKTQQSTEEIQTLIERLQEGSRNAVEQTEQAVVNARESQAAFSESDDHLGRVNSAVESVFAQATEIASMAEEQSSVSEEIHRNIVAINDAADATSEAVATAAREAAGIREAVQDVSTQVQQFRV
ncbi:methyl-accepting chemotaxis protein [Hahella sp. SMD15-11]|uniref:Methyl-accepting chemotaxis protein n=1 Tax=Thermohahella caldifontis TaxID=3142973 RepID=A0AB39UVN5_9GAMM